MAKLSLVVGSFRYAFVGYPVVGSCRGNLSICSAGSLLRGVLQSMPTTSNPRQKRHSKLGTMLQYMMISYQLFSMMTCSIIPGCSHLFLRLVRYKMHISCVIRGSLIQTRPTMTTHRPPIIKNSILFPLHNMPTATMYCSKYGLLIFTFNVPSAIQHTLAKIKMVLTCRNKHRISDIFCLCTFAS